jgi:hypothetical protein
VVLARAYYRAYSATSTDYASAASKAVLEWKYLTRIVSLKVSPGTVRKHGKITVSARLRQYNRTWRDFRKQRIPIVLKPRGSKVWYWIVKVTTSKTGFFSAKFTDPVSATWSAQYNGGKSDFACIGAKKYVRLAAATMVAGLEREWLVAP